jgi:hypothetical protein
MNKHHGAPMKQTALILSVFVSLFGSIASSNIELAPPAFIIEGTRDRAIFVDFKSAVYNIEIDVATRSNQVNSKIIFESSEEGFPLFDLVPNPSEILLDGQSVTQKSVKLPSAGDAPTSMRVLIKRITSGIHTIEIKHSLDDLVFRQGAVRGAFFMSDLDDRSFLELYLPANLEFDQVAMTFNFKISGTTVEHSLFNNGETTFNRPSDWTIKFPEYFNCSSPFFHFGETTQFDVIHYDYQKKGGQELPVTIYANKSFSSEKLLAEFKTETNAVLAEFEKFYGPFAHPTLTIFATGYREDGMEYHGATQSGLPALKHEISHSYFARGVMPSNGNAGWIDEGMAIYVGGPGEPGPLNSFGSNMGGHSAYFRMTDDDGYKVGSGILDSLARQSSREKMTEFISDWYMRRRYSVITSEMLKTDLSTMFGRSVDDLFSKYVFGGNDSENKKTKSHLRKIHMSVQEARKLLERDRY